MACRHFGSSHFLAPVIFSIILLNVDLLRHQHLTYPLHLVDNICMYDFVNFVRAGLKRFSLLALPPSDYTYVFTQNLHVSWSLPPLKRLKFMVVLCRCLELVRLRLVLPPEPLLLQRVSARSVIPVLFDRTGPASARATA